MFLHLLNTLFENLHKQTKLPNLCPKPQASSSDTSIFPWFLHGFQMEPQAQRKQ